MKTTCIISVSLLVLAVATTASAQFKSDDDIDPGFVKYPARRYPIRPVHKPLLEGLKDSPDYRPYYDLKPDADYNPYGDYKDPYYDYDHILFKNNVKPRQQNQPAVIDIAEIRPNFPSRPNKPVIIDPQSLRVKRQDPFRYFPQLGK